MHHGVSAVRLDLRHAHELYQVIHTVIRQIFGGLWADRYGGARILDRYPLCEDLLVPIVHKNHVRVNCQAEILVHDGLFRLVPRSSGPLHRIRSNTNPSEAASELKATPKEKLPDAS